jgi:Ca-activated chloride channel family protein
LGTGNRDAIYNALTKTRAVGWTPITYSLKQSVASDFIGVKGKKHIILLTDGGENCDESPCTYVIELMKYRDDISIDVIAFDVNDYEARAQLKCTALTTSGKFFTANNASELRDSLFESLSIDKEVKGTIKVRPNN